MKYSAPTSLSPKALPLEGNFATVISIHAGSPGERIVQDYLKQNEWMGQLVTVTNKDNDHFNAMAASDFGFIYDGQMVSSANALHLPVHCMIDMKMVD